MISLPFLYIYLASLSLLSYLRPVLAQPPQQASDFESIESLVRFADQSRYIGRWSALTTSQENQSTMAGFTHSYGLSLVSRTQDIVLMDGEHLLNTKFVSIEIDIYDEAEEKRWDNKSTRVEGKVIKYKVGDNLDDLDLLITQECTTEKLTISLMDAENYEELDSLPDEKQNIIIRAYLIGGECPFSFSAIFTPDFQNRFSVDIQLICCIWLFVNMILRKWLRARGRTNQIQFVQAYLLSLIDDLIIYDHLFYGLTSKADLFSDKIRLISMVTLFVYTLFPARLDESRALFITRLSTIAIRTGLQWCFDIDYNPAGIILIFIAIPLLEFSYNFNAKRAIKYNKFLYLGTLLPHLITKFWNLHQKKILLLNATTWTSPIILLVTFFLIAFVILPLQDQITQKIRGHVREKYSAHVANINSEDSCSICLESLVLVNSNYEEPYEAQDQRSLQTLIKTKCGHTYHEKCLKKWLETKSVCCLCEAPIHNDFQYLYVLIHFSAA